jgi:Phosphotransferase enzyme family
VVAWVEDDLPILVLEDRSDAIWPPPWDRAQVEAAFSILTDLAQCQAPEGPPRLVNGERPDEGWHRVLAEPSEFLSLDLCDADWLEHNGPVLSAAAARAPLGGGALLHCDVRSDNLCFRGAAALLVDWNLAGIGNAQIDVAFWLPSLAAENGPPPESVLPDCPPEPAAYVSGFFACRAGQAEIPHAPLVRQVQRQQLRTALPWAARALCPPLPALHREPPFSRQSGPTTEANIMGRRGQITSSH